MSLKCLFSFKKEEKKRFSHTTLHLTLILRYVSHHSRKGEENEWRQEIFDFIKFVQLGSFIFLVFFFLLLHDRNMFITSFIVLFIPVYFVEYLLCMRVYNIPFLPISTLHAGKSYRAVSLPNGRKRNSRPL